VSAAETAPNNSNDALAQTISNNPIVFSNTKQYYVL
jgi:hypothetical protein